jgi:Ricin-type beta-trefoil lectin domain
MSAVSSWLTNNGNVDVVVDRIPDQAPLSAPQVVLNQTMSASGGSVTVPITFQSSHDAFAVYLTPSSSSSPPPSSPPPSSPPPSSPPPSGGAHAIVGAQSGRCLDVAGASTGNGTQTQLYDCWGGSNQSWTYTSSKQLMVYGNKCLDAAAHGTTGGTAVQIWDCNGQANQQWNVNAGGTISGVESGLCLDAVQQGTANGTKINLWSCNGQGNQQWSMR